MIAPAHTHVPDILDCLAQLSSDEVPTPPKLASSMLELLPADVWTNPDYRWLDPCSKSGVFLREVAKRLLFEGLVDWEPDFNARREHIFRNMIYGCGITELTGIVSRRTVYYSRHASGPHAVIPFDDDNGNIPFIRAEHFFSNGRCATCGAPEDLDRGQDRENHAYAFIHSAYPTKELKEMKFDVIVGNPPFQLGDGGGGGGASATPVYNYFVERALELGAKHVLMITPSRWFSGGKGLDRFRERMLEDTRFVKLVDHPLLYDCFPGVKIRGGVSYWLWSEDHDGPCEIITKHGDEVVSGPASRYLGEFDVFVRRNEAVEILEKVKAFRTNGEPEPALSLQVSVRRPFGLTTGGGVSPDGIADPVLVYGNQSTSYIERAAIPTNAEWVDDWKVLLVKAHGTSGREDLTVLGEPIIAAPGTACTETYLVVGRYEDEESAARLAAFMRTRLVRFLVSLRKITQNMTRDSYAFVPAVPLDRTWSDADLYERYLLTDPEIEFIESQIKESPSDEEAGD